MEKFHNYVLWFSNIFVCVCVGVFFLLGAGEDPSSGSEAALSD